MTAPAGRVAAVLAALVCAATIAGAGPAGAHVHAVSPDAVRGGFAIVTFEVPNESPTGSPTTELTVTLPDVASARTEATPGWTARLQRDAATGAVRSVTWSAVGSTGIGADQFGTFRISMRLPDTDTVRFPAAQRYADGTVVRWDQPPLPDGGEPERPAPELDLSDAAASAEAAGGSVDNPARLLAGVALLTAALGATVAIVRRRA